MTKSGDRTKPTNCSPGAPRRIILRKGCERRLIQGHDWVFSNEVEPPAVGEPAIVAGDLVHICDRRGKFLASAYYNPHTLIAARVVSRRPLANLDAEWIRSRLQRALALRETLFSQPYYRWVHGEGDYLPGLVIDRFGDCVSAVISTAGMEQRRPAVIDALQTFPGVRGIVIQTDSAFAALEQIPAREPEIVGEVPDQVIIPEGELAFETSLATGQKTGWYFDQTANRQRFRKYLNGGPVLDLFCYAGAWGITAARLGARRVVCGDASAAALALAERNAQRNDVRIETIGNDAFDILRQLQSGPTFQTIVLDPPALIKRKKDFESGLQAYYQLNRLAARILSPDGMLISCSCSHHLPTATLVEIVHHAAKSVERRAVLAEIGQQSPDHPQQPAIPETAYLKAVFCQFREEM